MRRLTFDEIASRRADPKAIHSLDRLPVVALLENVRSLYNVGSIFRTSDAVALQKLVLSGFTPSPPRKEIDKTALGSTQTVPWEHRQNPLEAVGSYRSQGYRICAVELTDSGRPYDSILKTDFPLLLALGSEVTGLSSELVAACDMAVEIPMFGMKHSLNIAVAFGIVVYQLSRVWRGDHHSNARV